ncbi:MAG: hypothetical protein MUC93_01965 [Bacteroidales bacterium]|jgi:hypothetical protein|nr:hypothetical protein [Bacteroidales bacterium]
MKNRFLNTFLVIIIFLLVAPEFRAQKSNVELNKLRTIPVKHYIFSKTDMDASIWSAMYIASNNKIYIGLCTHADAANVYEFDISTSTMKHLANLTILLDERGKGIWTNGKIHVRMQELDGYVYFGSFCEDNGPPAIDANSYNGPRWFRINMETGRVEPLSKINSFWGLTGQTMDKMRRIIYGLDEIGHLSRYFIDEDYTEDMGRVDNWDICRTIFIDESGNVYGSYPPGRIWKYDVNKDRIFNLEFLRLPVTLDSRTMANPMLDRRAQWRYIEWDPVDKVAYGIIGGSNLLFRYDVNKGQEGEITPLTLMCAPFYREGRFFDIPHATLAMTINQKDRKIYYLPVTSGDFDYGLVNKDIGTETRKSDSPIAKPRTSSYMVTYDLKTGKREDLGILKPTDGSYASGMGAAETDKDGKIWFVGLFEQTDEALKINGGFRKAMGLGCYDPFTKN